MSTSKEYLKLKKKNNNQSLSKLRKQKYNFEPTYHQVIKDSIKNDKQGNKYYDKLIEYFESHQL